MRFSFAILFWLLSVTGGYADDFNYDAFSRLPVQHEGRIKPMETFALVHLDHFRGSSHDGDTSAIAWLASIMFDPSRSLEKPLFLVKNADTQSMLGLESKPDHLYSFAEATQAISKNEQLIRSLLQKPLEELSPGQHAALELYQNTGLFTQITLSCSLFLHLSVELPADRMQQLGIDDNTVPPSTFTDYYKYLPQLQRDLQKLVDRKGSDIDQYTMSEIQLAQSVERLAMTMESSRDNALLRVIPPQWGNGDGWVSPWEVFHAGQGSPKAAEIMALWRDLAASYQEQDAVHWQLASAALLEKYHPTPSVRPAALSLEVLYHRYEPLGKSMALYILGFILTLFCLSGLQWSGHLRRLAIGITATGVALHFMSILARVFILERPPVGTLYESLLFVSLIAALFGLYLERRLHNYLGLLVATLAGSGLLFMSQSFSSDDTMSMLIAVLNTNFWLATHVLCITTGYGFGIVAGIIAHVYLLMRVLKIDPDKTRQILRSGYGTALIALLFTSLGTILGGIWADQSWGRFWGWDPKENGALIICLWLIWLLHGRISGRFHELGFAAGLALLNVVIALSWLGVNLLSTGLHSYGFTDKAAWGLGLFCTTECLFTAITFIVIGRRENVPAH